ncbi:hypothetical protein CDAR_368191 [Caerostris darwini]|uniref:Uncharacterized protein n=1 Tax=Caerostris darwini TaxID=1538125 RepID=A0AAV4WDL1_9ARAC|nr:hypothetical protein CDAR_368191 [Caerostris darwini]
MNGLATRTRLPKLVAANSELHAQRWVWEHWTHLIHTITVIDAVRAHKQQPFAGSKYSLQTAISNRQCGGNNCFLAEEQPPIDFWRGR